jgi:hypothetical protein
MEAMEARDIRDCTPIAEGAAPKRDSGIRPVAQAERATVPPPRRGSSAPLPSTRRALTAAPAAVAEVLYRLSVGDGAGAVRAGEDLAAAVPVLSAMRGVRADAELGLSEQYLLTLIDGAQSCRALLEGSQLAPEDSLRGLCELVDRGLVTLW